MFDGSQRRCAGATIVAGNHEMISLGLGDSRGNRAHTDFRYQFDADACLAVCVLQVVNQLRDILNRIDIVMRRRLIRPTPGVECRIRAICSSTLPPGNSPPSPGLAP